MSELDPNPEANIKPSGSILVYLDVGHPLLAREAFALCRNLPVKRARLQYIDKDADEIRTPTISQTIGATAGSCDEIANGQLAFAKHIYPTLLPTYGWIDDPGEKALPGKFTSIAQVRYVFWANVFSAEFVAEFGKEFLAAAPAFRIDWFDDGGAVLVATESYQEWYSSPPQELADYLAQKVPGIRNYRKRK